MLHFRFLRRKLEDDKPFSEAILWVEMHMPQGKAYLHKVRSWKAN